MNIRKLVESKLFGEGTGMAVSTICDYIGDNPELLELDPESLCSEIEELVQNGEIKLDLSGDLGYDGPVEDWYMESYLWDRLMENLVASGMYEYGENNYYESINKSLKKEH